ncbi:MAG: hypothetical protein IBX72_11280 [Nitrospirae bacterium]|nr:hypothetical protein [Nitrospirota bacterium]
MNIKTIFTVMFSFLFLCLPLYAEESKTRTEQEILAESLQKEKQLIEESKAKEQEKKDIILNAIERPSEPEIQWKFNRMPLDIFVNTLSDQGIVLEMRNIPESIKNVTVNWKGYDIKDALKSIFPACYIDHQMYKYVVDCMITKKIRLPFTYSVSSLNVSAAIDPSGSTTGSTIGTPGVYTGSASSRSTEDYVMTRDFNYYKLVFEEAKKLLSKSGTLSVSYAGGFVMVKDYMENVEAVERFITSELNAVEQVKFQVKLVKVTLKRGHEYGIDWNHVLSNALTKNITLSVSSAGNVTNPVLALAGGKQNWDFIVNAMSSYGDISVVHNWDVVAKGGETVILKHVTNIPYVSDVQTSQSTVSTITTPSFSSQEVGLKIIFDFTKSRDEININGVIDVSAVKEFKQFQVAEYNVERPSITKDFVRFQSKAYLGESLIVSGFKIDSEDKESRSIPLVSKIPVIGWIFGYDKKAQEKEEYLVIITPVGAL